ERRGGAGPPLLLGRRECRLGGPAPGGTQRSVLPLLDPQGGLHQGRGPRPGSATGQLRRLPGSRGRAPAATLGALRRRPLLVAGGGGGPAAHVDRRGARIRQPFPPAGRSVSVTTVVYQLLIRGPGGPISR